MEDIVLESFPFDSMQVLNEDTGQMEDDRLYEAQIFRNYFRKFLSNGVYYGNYKNYGENAMKVTSEGGMLINVAPGAGMIEGADFENIEDREITLERPDSGRRLDRIVIQFNSSLNKRNTSLTVKQGNGTTPAALTRNENIYEICIAEVMVKSTTTITQADITDTRPNSELCGIVNSLISVDGEELYQNFQNYINERINNILFKDTGILQQLADCQNQDNKVPSAKLLYNCMQNIQTITHTTTLTKRTSTQITKDYPQGFNKENSVAIALFHRIRPIGSTPDYYSWIIIDTFNNPYTKDIKMTMQMDLNNIYIFVQNSTDDSFIFEFKIVLLKIA